MSHDRTVPTLVTSRLRLTIPEAGDAEAMAAYFDANRDHLGPWSPPQPREIADAAFWRSRLPTFADDFRRDAALRFALFPFEGDTRSIVGTANFTQIFRGPFQACYLGYSIGRAYEGRGLMREALEAGIAYVFGEMHLHRIMANYVPTNERSGRLLRRLGFVVEGYARDYLYIDGAWRDHVLTALTNPTIERP